MGDCIKLKKKGEIDDWYMQEWSDAYRILKLGREDLLWEIWKERSNKLLWGLVGIIIGLVIGRFI